MQYPYIQLQEVIWEVTGACRNHCSYCGSKEGWNEPIDEHKIKQIADQIAEFPPKEIDISGGDPLLLSITLHKYIVTTLKKVGTCCKIIVNPKSIKSGTEIGILNHYDYIGISINHPSDIELMEEWKIEQFKFFSGKLVAITNFNINNIFDFEKIKQFVNKHNLSWQIQYTIFNDPKDIRAIYNNNDAFNFLAQKIDEAIKQGIKIVIADNMNANACPAGTRSLGILSDGSIVPCLSMRSWQGDIKEVSQGNILEKGLRFIWENKFQNYRFCQFKCCKDHTNNKYIAKYIPYIEPDKGSSPFSPNDHTITVYAVQPWKQEEPIVIYYGVRPQYDPKDMLVLAYAVRSWTTAVTSTSIPNYFKYDSTTNAVKYEDVKDIQSTKTKDKK